MASTELPGYDAINDNSGTYESMQESERLKESLGQMWEAAKQAGATKVRSRHIERVEFVDGENNGYEHSDPDERRIRIEQPELEVSEWRTYTDKEAGLAYHWSVSRPVDKPDTSPMLTLETPVQVDPWSLKSMKVAAIGTGFKLEGRRIQDYIVGDDGKLHGRSADYTKLAGGDTYRIIAGSQKSWEATENEATFIRDNLSRAELDGQSSDGKAITVSDVAPNFPSV